MRRVDRGVWRRLRGACGSLAPADFAAAAAWLVLIAVVALVAVPRVRRSAPRGVAVQRPAVATSPVAAAVGLGATPASAPPLPAATGLATLLQRLRPGARMVQQVTIPGPSSLGGMPAVDAVLMYSEAPAPDGCSQPAIDVLRPDGQGGFLPTWEADLGLPAQPPLLTPVQRLAGRCLPAVEQLSWRPLESGGRPMALIVLALPEDRKRIAVLDLGAGAQPPRLLVDDRTAAEATVSVEVGQPAIVQITADLPAALSGGRADTPTLGQTRWTLSWRDAGFRLLDQRTTLTCLTGTVAGVAGSRSGGLVLMRCADSVQLTAVLVDATTAFVGGSRFDLLQVGDDVRLSITETPAPLETPALPHAALLRSVAAALRVDGQPAAADQR